MRARKRTISLLIAVGSTVLFAALLVWVLNGTSTAATSRSAANQAVTEPAMANQAVSAMSRAQPLVDQVPPSPHSSRSAAEEVQRAWQRAGDLGVYHFATSLVERRYPAPSVIHVGGGPQQREIWLEGDVDLPARRMTMRLWQGGASLANPTDSAEIRIEKNKTYMRRPGAQEWQPVEDSSSSSLTEVDSLSYLSGIKNVTELGSEKRVLPGPGEITYTRYGFEMDGPALAIYMRDRQQQVLIEQGKLPPGVTLQTAREYEELIGEGEVWLDAEGLPLRLTMHLRYPPMVNGSYYEADVQSDFSGFPQPEVVTLPSSLGETPAWVGTVWSYAGQQAQEWQPAGHSGLALTAVLGLVILIVACRRSRRLYVAVVVAVILSMTVVPLLQNTRVAAFMAEQAVRKADADEKLRDEQTMDEFAVQRTSWDPHRDPLPQAASGLLSAAVQAPAVSPPSQSPTLESTTSETPTCDKTQTADGDNDGLSDYDECIYGTLKSNAHSDPDGLTDGQEVNYLGTSPILADTDGDMITDKMEVEGFIYPANGQHWYLDPRNPDTNGDGWSDGLECPPMWRDGDSSTAAIAAECDTNGDGIPNLFESDNEGDGVPDGVDLSPNEVLDRNGVHSDVTNIAPFNRDQPFLLKVQDLQADWPVFLDLQLRPENPKHLTYALNILDWPAQDTDGQIQHAKNTTFATFENPNNIPSDDDPGAYGDMRLVPMLEIEMSGLSLPLKLTTPAVTATVASGSSVLSTTVKFRQDQNDTAKTHIEFAFGQPGTYNAKIYGGACSERGDHIWDAPNITNGQVLDHVGTKDDGWLNSVADGKHALVVSNGTTSACTNIPNIINGPYTSKMVDQSVLTPYGIGLIETGSDVSREVLAYIPLNAVSDDTGGKRVAFSARMLYWPGQSNSWDQAQQIRMVWVVEALTDSCNTSDPEFPQAEDYPEDDDGEQLHEDQREFCLKTENRSPDTMQIVQVYDDSFHITGLSVREDHGLDVAVAYPKPTIKPYDEEPLWQLSWGLGHSFLTGQDCENDDTIVSDLHPEVCHNDGVRDLTVFEQDSAGNRIGNSTIEERFGTSDSAWTGSPALWGIAQGALGVESRRYPTQDHLAKVPMEVTPAILEQYTDTSVTPSLLFAREEHYRSAGLEAGTKVGDVMTINVGANYHEQTLAVMNWAPFRYNSSQGPDGAKIGWEMYPLEEYYDTLNARLRARFIAQYPDDDDETITGEAAVAQGYYVSLYNGIAGMVYPCPDEGEGEESCAANEVSKTVEELTEASEKMVDAVLDITFEIAVIWMELSKHYKKPRPAGAIQLFDDVVDNRPISPGAFKVLGHAIKNYFVGPWPSFFNSGNTWSVVAGVGTALFVAGAIITIILACTLGTWDSGAEIVRAALLVLGVVLNTLAAVKAVSEFVQHQIAQGFEEVFVAGAAGAGRHSEGGVTASGVLKLAIQVLLLWAAFLVVWLTSDLRFGSMAINDLFADFVAWVLVAILMFIISLLPFGKLIVAIIAAIDALVRLICGAFVDEEHEETWAAENLCGGISGLLKWIYKRAIYSGTLLVVTEPEDYERLELWNLNASNLLDPERGVTEGNAVKYSVALTNTIQLAKATISAVSWTSVFYWNTENLRKASFEYKWQAEKHSFHKHLSMDGMPDPGWESVTGEKNRYEYYTTIPSEEAFPLPETGIDQPMGELYFSEAYALPEAECWGWRFRSVCFLQPERGTVHYPFGDFLKYDVLPADLDGFYQLQATTGGYKLAWDPLFPPMHDADGDGLPYSTDSDDTTWDADGDGLSDQYEVQTGTNAKLVDTDHDGLTDYQEARLGSNPLMTDSDGDGLYDCQEVFHQVISPDYLTSTPGDVCGEAGSWSGGWELVYGTENGNQLITLVYADPTSIDADGDSYADSRERIYGFHPGVPSLTNLLSLSSQVNEIHGGVEVPTDKYVRPGDRLSQSATVKNELDAREAQGLMWTEGKWLVDGGTAPQSFVLMPKQEQTVSSSMQVSGLADSGSFTLTQAAGALISDWREISGDADLWLPFDDATTATTFADISGSIPANDGVCTGPAGSCSIVESGGQYGSAVQLNGQGYVATNARTSASAFSISLWFKMQPLPIGTTGEYALFSTAAATGPILSAEIHNNAQGPCIWMPHSSNPYSSYWVGMCEDDPEVRIADGKWHHVVSTCSGNQLQLYLDGRPPLSTSVGDCGDAGTAKIGAPANAGGLALAGFPGQIDDVRLYPRSLSPQEVHELFNEPVFNMNFEQHTAWTDAGSYQTPVTCSAVTCPAHDSLGLSGWGATFEDRERLTVGDTTPNAHLNLSGGQFTISVWLQPSSTCPISTRRTILGSPLGTSAYPTLSIENGVVAFEPLNTKVSAWGGLRLTNNIWNHLAVVYDKSGGGGPNATLKYYLNGEFKESYPISLPNNPHPVPLPTTHFYIGSQPDGSSSFCGKIDNVQIFNRLFTDDGVKELMLDSAAALHLSFNEPPGTSVFADTSIMHKSAVCSPATCPTAGVGGRMDQAASFNTVSGHASDHLVLPNSETNSSSDRKTVAAWIKLSALSNFYQTIASTAATETFDGWGFGVHASELMYRVAPDTWVYNSSGANLQAGRWTHVAAVLDTTSYGKTLQFYVNGQAVGAPINMYHSELPDIADQFLIGAATFGSLGGVTDVWHGAIDDLRIYHMALTADQIGKLYRMAPVLHLRFDENYGAITFANGANPAVPGSCSPLEKCPFTGEGIQGQMWLAARFDGQNDVVTVPNFGDFTETTVSAWIKRTSANNVRETVFSYKEAQGLCGFVLGMNNDNQNQLPSFWVNTRPTGGLPAWHYATSPNPVPMDSWHHLAGTYDGKTIRLYQNGNLMASTVAPGTMVQCSQTSSIGARASNDLHFFPGLIDEVQVFDHALTATEIHDKFTYQNGWVEERSSSALIVDTVGPRGTVIVGDPPYQANWPAQVLVTASDETSGVELVQLCVGTADCSTVPPAPACIDPKYGAAWCPTFSPNGQGIYSLSARISDKVGYITTTATKAVYVDDTAPQVTLAAPANGSWYTAREYQGKSNKWYVPFSGTVSDPALSATIPGSGVPAEGVRVTLYRGDGGLVGSGSQLATVSEGTWTIDYLFGDADPSGCYKVVVEAVDRMARIAGLPDAQVARHTTTIEQPISVDADPTFASIDWGNVPGGQLGPDVNILDGPVSARPIPVVLDFIGGTNSAQTELILTCQHGNEGSWWQPYSTYGWTLAPAETYTWGQESKPIIHRGSSCQVQLKTSAATDDLSGTVTICGQVILNWSGTFNGPEEILSFIADADSCGGGNGCPLTTEKATAGVQGVDVSFLPLTPGSSFFNETPPAGELLHLTMDTSLLDGDTLTYPDVSANRLTGTCSGSACPVGAQQGHAGNAAFFDGADAISLPQVTGQGTTNTLTAAAWIYPTLRSDGIWNRGTILSRYGLWEVECTSDGHIRWIFRNTNPGWSPHDTGFAAPLNQWTHIAVVYDNGVVRTYANGVLVDTYNGAGTISNAAALNIGGEPAYGEYFSGLLDEVRLFNLALTAEEIQALYIGSGPVLVLPLDKQWAADGSEREDISGWQRNGVLHTGSGDVAGKAVTGQVGPYALQLDGVNDYIVIGDDDAIDFPANHDFAIAVWVKPDATQPTATNSDSDIVEKWTGPGGYPYVIRYINQKGGADAGKIVVARYDGTNNPTIRSTKLVNDGNFHHIAFVREAGKLKLYIDGILDRETTDTTTGNTTNTSALFIGQRGNNINHFAGAIDDLRIYPRSLSLSEVRTLFLMGWQPATVAESGDTIETSRWEISTPAWLEGTYRIEARGWDTDGHTSPPSSPVQTWSGEADTLAPRVKLVRIQEGAGYRYITTAEDYNLTSDNLQTPCPSDTTSVTTNFESPWYLAAYPTSPRLYRLVQECTLASQAADERATACDTFGNCATVDATFSASISDLPVEVQDALAKMQVLTHNSAAVAPKLEVTAADRTDGMQDVTFVSQVLTRTHLHPQAVLQVTGLVNSSEMIEDVTVHIGDSRGEASLAAPTNGWAMTSIWSYPWSLDRGALPDGVSYRAEATATLVEDGSPVVKSTQLMVDVVPPSAVPLTLQQDGQSLEPGDTVRTTAPELLLSWPTASDGSGVAGYVAHWTIQSADGISRPSRTVGTSESLEARLTPGEAQKVTVDLASKDLYGNVRWQQLGPIYVDSPLTPDYIGLSENPYLGWQESGCSLLGADRRRQLRAPGTGQPQRLYATWDAIALRLAWTGASWSSDGDLFIYLDTQPGGTTNIYNPTTPDPGRLQLTNQALQADYLVWVQDARTATLLAWNGSDWSTVAALSERQYRFKGSQTDLYLPFELLGLNPTSSLGLVAVATADPVAGEPLQLWATLPQFNPVNSALVNRMLSFMPEGMELALKHAYHWPALNRGICPNGSDGTQPLARFGDVHSALSIQSDPPGAGLNGLGSGLFWVTESVLASAGQPGQTALSFLRPNQTPVQVGQEIHYTVRYSNAGTETQQGVKLVLTGYGIDLATDTLELGDVAPGTEVRATFAGQVTGTGPRDAWAVVHGLLYDAYHPAGEALEWLWAAHRVDQSPPETVSITNLRSTVGPNFAGLRGLATDESGVASVEVEITGPNGVTTFTCTVARPGEGRWQCPWHVGGAPHGTQFVLRVRATDVLGHTSDWSPPRVVTVDAQPPDLQVMPLLSSALLKGGMQFHGEMLDPSGIGRVHVCIDGQCDKARLLAAEASSAHWTFQLPRERSDYISKTISIYGTDKLGNRTEEVQVPIILDNVSPELNASQVREQLMLGDRQVILQGTIQDGDPGARIFVQVQAPNRTQSRQKTARSGDQWWYELPGELPGRYTLWLYAVDAAGNSRTTGPFYVDVTCTDATLLTSLSAEREATDGIYLLTAVISNTGTAPLPAGASLALYVDEALLENPQSLPAIDVGQTNTVTAQWTRPEPRGYELSAVIDGPPGEVLCATPPGAMLWLSPDVNLHISKTVQPATAVPGDVISYTLVYSNTGSGLATGVVISDPMPIEILAPTYQASGALITPTISGGNFVWQVANLAAGQGGQIVISGTVDPGVTSPITITNIVTITSPSENDMADNVASVPLPVLRDIDPTIPRIWLPWILR